MTPFLEVMRDHGATVIMIFLAVVFTGFVGITALIVFTRWVVHSEVSHLTSTIHKDILSISSRLDNLVNRRWADIELDRKFADVDSLLGSHETAIRRHDEAIVKLTGGI